MDAQFARSNWLPLLILALLLLAGCGETRLGPPTSAAATTGCPDAPGPIAEPIVVAAANNLIALNEDGSSQHWLLSLSEEASAAFPAWSPDGRTLAYALRRPAPSPKLRGILSVICGIERATGKGRLLAAGSEDDWLDEPGWSADSQSLVLTLNRFQVGANQQMVDKRHVARYDLATKTLQILVADAHSPVISSAGDRLAYIAIDPQSQTEALFVARHDGQEARLLIALQQPYVSAMWPRWSPDDTQMLFGAGMIGGEDDERYAVCVIGVDGQGFQQLSNDVNNVVSVDWGSDSSKIAYASSGRGLFIRDLGQDQTRNVVALGDGMGVSWARR